MTAASAIHRAARRGGGEAATGVAEATERGAAPVTEANGIGATATTGGAGSACRAGGAGGAGNAKDTEGVSTACGRLPAAGRGRAAAWRAAISSGESEGRINVA